MTSCQKYTQVQGINRASIEENFRKTRTPHAKGNIATNAATRRAPEPTSCEAALEGAVVGCTTVVATIVVSAEVALPMNGPEGDRLVKESMVELKVVLRGIGDPVPMLEVVPTELVMFIELVIVAFDDDGVDAAEEYMMLEDPVPPTREKRPE